MDVGAYSDKSNVIESGHMQVYIHIGDFWVKVGYDIDWEGNYDKSGYYVSIYSDLSSVDVCDSYNYVSGIISDHIWVYGHIGDSWVNGSNDIYG